MSALRARIRSALPSATVERIARWRRRLRASSLSGDAVSCPLCDGRFAGFLPAGERHPIFERHDFVAGGHRPNVRCPRCDSRERERLLRRFLDEPAQAPLLNASASILHFAPERRLETFFRGTAASYVTADLDGAGVDRRIDVTDIPFAAATFDLVVCNHVLEHVPDDRRALEEIGRVLKPDGVAVVQVPRAVDLETTYEDPGKRTEAERIEAFGQFDHVRIYGRDYAQRLSAAALAFDGWLPGEDDCRRFGLDRRDPLMVGRHRARDAVVDPG